MVLPIPAVSSDSVRIMENNRGSEYTLFHNLLCTIHPTGSPSHSGSAIGPRDHCHRANGPLPQNPQPFSLRVAVPEVSYLVPLRISYECAHMRTAKAATPQFGGVLHSCLGMFTGHHKLIVKRFWYFGFRIHRHHRYEP